jgi:hypothetical protein
MGIKTFFLYKRTDKNIFTNLYNFKSLFYDLRLGTETEAALVIRGGYVRSQNIPQIPKP